MIIKHESITPALEGLFWEIDIECAKHTILNPQLLKALGHSGQYLETTSEQIKNLIHPEDLEIISNRFNSIILDDFKSHYTCKYRVKKQDNSYAFIEESGFLVKDEKGNPTRLMGMLKDYSPERIKELQKSLHHEVIHLMKNDVSLSKALHEVLAYISQYGNFILSEVWLVSEYKNEIFLHTRGPSNKTNRKFYTISGAIKYFKKGKGLPGIVWKEKSTQLWDINSMKEKGERYKGIQGTSIDTIFGLPLIHGETVIGVLVLGTDQGPTWLNDNQTIFDSLKQFLGAEIKRRLQEKELHSFFNSAPDIMAVAGPDGYFKKVNPAFCDLLGYTEKELTSTPFITFIHPNDLKDTSKEYEETITGDRKATNFVNRYRTKSGHYKWISWSSSTAFAEAGYVFAYGRDITDKKELQDLLNRVSNMARIGGWEIDFINKIHYWSPITKEIHEVSMDFQPNLKTAIDFYREDVRNNVNDIVNNTLSNGDPFDFEMPIITALGNEKWIRAIGQAEFANDGTCLRLFGSFQDISDHKETALRLKSISDNVPGVIFQYHYNTDGSDSLNYVSEGAYEIWGLTPDECMNDSSTVWKGIAKGGDIDGLKQSIIDSATSFKQWQYQWKYIKPDGSVRYHKGIGNPKQMPDGSVRWDSIIVDDTDKKIAELELDRKNNYLSVISQVVSCFVFHDNWFTALEEVFELTGKALKVDRVYYFENYHDSVAGKLFSSQKYEWTNGIVSPEIDNPKMQHMDSLQFPELFDPLIHDKICVANVKELPKGAYKRILISQDVVSILVLPVEVEGYFYGFVGFDNCLQERDWTEWDIAFLKSITSNLASAIQKQKARFALEKAFNEKNTVLESIGDGFFTLNQEWEITYWNTSAEIITGIPKEDIINKDFTELFPEIFGEKFFREIAASLYDGASYRYEAYIRPLSIWVEANIYPLDTGVSVYFKDITERKESEKALKEANERFEKVTEATQDAVWDWDVEMDSLHRSQSFQTLFGYNTHSQSSYSEFWKDKIHAKDVAVVLKSIEEIITNPKATHWEKEYRIIKECGETAYVIDRGLIIRKSNGQATRMVGAVADITPRKKQEESLRKLNKRLKAHAQELATSNAELEQFAYVASHDLQEPLRMVTSFLTQLEKKYSDSLDEKAHQYIHFAVDGAKRMRNIILDLLDYSRVGKTQDEMEEIDMNELLDEIQLLQRKRIEESHATIKSQHLPTIKNKRTPIRQILQNLIENALKYHKPGVPPVIKVSFSETKRFWEFTIKDNGVGIDPEYHDKIFIIFQRLENIESHKGTGMGLALAKKIISNMGGNISVKSTFGDGSAFSFSIPK